MKHTLLLPLPLLLLAACTSDLPSDGPKPGAERIQVGFTLATSSTGANAWTYKDGEGNEFIQDGFCVMIDEQSREVEHIFYCAQKNQNIKEGAVTTALGSNNITTSVGRKLFYTFANLTKEEVEAAIQKVNGMEGFTFNEHETVDTAKVNQAALAISADNFTPTTTKGIPMTGRQYVSLAPSDNGKVRSLYVVRMMGKLQFEFTNATANELTVESVSIDKLADNPEAGQANLRLFPAPLTPTINDGANVTIVPNLTDYGKLDSRYSTHTYDVGQKLAQGESTSLSVYVNESERPNTQFEEYTLTVKLKDKDGETEQRYALVSNENDDWDYIARNDWRHIPITIQDYVLELIPQDFPPIGVLPCSVKEADGTFTCTFHTFGAFHLYPRLTNRSTAQVIDTWTADDVEWKTLVDNTSLYETAPYWHSPGRYVHGTFKRYATGSSTHVLTLTANPEGVTARTFSVPVIIKRED